VSYILRLLRLQESIWRAEDVTMSLSKRLSQRGRCLVCRAEFTQPKTGRRRMYCSPAHKEQARYWRTRKVQAFQSFIREQVPTLAGCYVEKIKAAEAKQVILRYEWLGTMPGRTASCYGLKSPTGALLGVTVFGYTMSPESREICGKENRHLAICLERGACVPDAPENAASFLISRAIKLAAEEHDWRIFYAYADPEAGEVGTIYQALNWLRLPNTRSVENLKLPDGKSISERSLRLRGTTRQDVIDFGADVIVRSPKRKYVTFAGDNKRERKKLRAALRSEVQPY
jgi:hypothetical protein